LKAARITAKSKLKAYQFKNNLAGSVFDSIFEKTFLEIDKKEQIRLRNELLRLGKEQVQLQETAGNQKMVKAILTSVIDKAAHIGELNVQAQLKTKRNAVNAAKKKALKLQAQQENIDREIVEKEKTDKKLKEVDAKVSVPVCNQEVFAPEEFIVNRKTVNIKPIDVEKENKSAFHIYNI